jgi:hypothetical protein
MAESFVKMIEKVDIDEMKETISKSSQLHQLSKQADSLGLLITILLSKKTSKISTKKKKQNDKISFGNI